MGVKLAVADVYQKQGHLGIAHGRAAAEAGQYYVCILVTGSPLSSWQLMP